MKILFLANHFNTGGITSYLLTLSRALIGRGHQVLVASSGGNMVQELEADGARHVHFAFDVKCEAHPRLFPLSLRLAALLRDEKVGVVHAQTRVTQVCAAMASRIAGVPYVSTCHGFFRPHLGRRLLPLWGMKVIAVSSQVQEHLKRDFYLPESLVALVPNGIDLARFVPPGAPAKRALRLRWGYTDEPLFGIVARLSDVKGHQDLIKAVPLVLSRFPGAKCLIFGDGPMEEKLKAMVREDRLEQNIHFYPVVNRTAEVLPLLDVFVMPSLQEGLGLSVMEAAAMGLPSVVSRVGGLPDVVKDGETGYLVPPRDPAALARAIAGLFSDPGRIKMMGDKAREFITSDFSAGPMTERTLAVYREATAQGSSRKDKT